MRHVWRKFCQGLENESALVHSWMRNDQVCGFDDEVVIKKDVDVDDACAFGLRTKASHFFLDRECKGKELSGRELCIESDSTVQEPGLWSNLDGLGFIQRRLGPQ